MKNKNEKQNKNNAQDENQYEKSGKGYGYASFCLAVAAIILAPLTFIMGIYGLCASVICALASLAFYNSQKTRGLFILVKAAKITAYIALVFCVVILIGAIIYSAL